MSPENKKSDVPRTVRPNRLMALSLGAIGVVYGDIGTSPLYALRECFHGANAIPLSRENILGVLSLILWSLLIVISIKYLGFVLRADNDGEGGVLSLMALALGMRSKPLKRPILVALGLCGAGLLYGDGMITPAISVLSAMEGLHVVTDVFDDYVVPVTILILFMLFIGQKRGTARVASIFGPIMLVWFGVLVLLGLPYILQYPDVLSSASPHYAVSFILENRGKGFVILGVVFLVVTGGEALYADMGHFGAKPIRRAWFAIVLPALLVNYYGQGALLLHDPLAVWNPFYHLAPMWARYPLILLATAATVIASQAVISGAFSLARQAVHLGYAPRLLIRHTSGDERGQVYVPAVNWFLFVAVVVLVLVFRSSGHLAAAYGIAVSSTMLITTLLYYVVMRSRWGWPLLPALGITCFFLIIDVVFLSANLVKVLAGGWLPLVVAAVVWCCMATWKRGRTILARKLKKTTVSIRKLMEQLDQTRPVRVPGAALFLTAHDDGAPAALMHNLRHNKVLHETVGILHIVSESVPRVRKDRVTIDLLGRNIYRITARYGFMERPSVRQILSLCRDGGLNFPVEDTTFFVGRETLEVGRTPEMGRWRTGLFAWMGRNAHDASVHFGLPPNRVVEIGVQLKL